jgi:Uma2 family endonuclease
VLALRLRARVCERRVRATRIATDSALRLAFHRGLAPNGYPCIMATLVLDPYAYELDALLERRRVSGLDRLDEVWEGVLHMVPAPSYEHARITQQLAEILGPLARAAGLIAAMGEFNLGDSDHDFRVPDGGLHRPGAGGVWLHTAALVVEIVSPGDETWRKLPFYAAHEVDEVLILDPEERAIHWLGLADGEYQPVERSGVIDLGSAELAEQIDWP